VEKRTEAEQTSSIISCERIVPRKDAAKIAGKEREGRSEAMIEKVSDRICWFKEGLKPKDCGAAAAEGPVDFDLGAGLVLSVGSSGT
jgi:hypothetical protein